MIFDAARAAASRMFSAPFRSVLFKSIGLTLLILVGAWFGLREIFDALAMPWIDALLPGLPAWAGWLGLLAGFALAALPVIWTYVLRDYQKQRLLSFLDPAADPQGAGFQLLQSQVAVHAGGLMGTGLTNGAQGRLDILPVESTDFVFAILAEELGFIGGLVVFGLFIALLWRVLAAAWRSRDPFGLALGAGIASMVLFQLVVNIGMVLGVMPITGIPLPFVTHGGASLVSLALGLGLLQSINVHQARTAW